MSGKIFQSQWTIIGFLFPNYSSVFQLQDVCFFSFFFYWTSRKGHASWFMPKCSDNRNKESHSFTVWYLVYVRSTCHRFSKKIFLTLWRKFCFVILISDWRIGLVLELNVSFKSIPYFPTFRFFPASFFAFY